jgi:hypothetical protein
MIISVVYLVVRCLLGCLMMLTQRQMSKDAQLLVLRHETRYSAARSATSGPEPPGYDRGTRTRRVRVTLRWRGSRARTDTTHCPISRHQLQR